MSYWLISEIKNIERLGHKFGPSNNYCPKCGKDVTNVRENIILTLNRYSTNVKAKRSLEQILKNWRKELCEEMGITTFLGGSRIISNKMIEEIVNKLPNTEERLAQITGMGPKKMKMYKEDLLKMINTVIRKWELDLEIRTISYQIVCHQCQSFWIPTRSQKTVLSSGSFNIVDSNTGDVVSSTFELF